jgi:hypothetical protein
LGDESQASLTQHRRELHGIRDDRTRMALLDSNQPHLDSVTSRIGAAIIEFVKARDGLTFHSDDLRSFVRLRCGEVAPGSPDRILRCLRARRELDYEVVNRAQSLYRAGRAE